LYGSYITRGSHKRESCPAGMQNHELCVDGEVQQSSRREPNSSALVAQGERYTKNRFLYSGRDKSRKGFPTSLTSSFCVSLPHRVSKIAKFGCTSTQDYLLFPHSRDVNISAKDLPSVLTSSFRNVTILSPSILPNKHRYQIIQVSVPCPQSGDVW
jgi:hypothetical protein